MKRFVAIMLSTAALALSGCPADSDASKKSSLTVRQLGPGQNNASSQPNGKPYMLIVRMRMASIEVPMGTASGTEELWSYLDEESIRGVGGAMGRNGWRAGVAKASTWPDIAKILKRMTGRRLKESNLTIVPGSPLHITLKERQAAQTIFVSHNDGTLSGADYPPGDNLLTITCTLDEDDASRVLITAMPQIRSTYRRPTFVKNFGRVTMVARPEFCGFRPLAFQVGVPAKDILIIGPNAVSRRRSSAGHHFLVRKKKGLDFETVLILSPEVFAAPLK